MTDFSRRKFLSRSLAGAGVLISHPLWATTENAASNAVLDKVALGKTGITVSRLAQGTGMHGRGNSSDHTDLGQKKFTELVMRGFDSGLNFLDMADLYGSHTFVKNALAGIPRDQYVLLSKIWPREHRIIKPSGGAHREFNRFRSELGTEMIDICLIHCAVNDQWTEEYKRIRDELSDFKQKGEVRAVGVSCHDFGALEVASRHPWVDVIFARINHMGGREYKMDGTSEDVGRVLKRARANGKAVVGMKIFAEGTLVKPMEKDASLRYVLENQLVDAITIGMLKPEEVDDSIRRVNKALESSPA